ncbi:MULTISPECIES: substrate-binding domain-containing protein [unclassified Leifsonia]|uniref:substrate-binding domain-containing protein n=1 Tax=unclassified Leifsonia TaxID=2663824 RepID=UPI0008A73C70|nr:MULTISPECIES: substrate-binding domain-containing protein [unclassified Leifsonia]SEI11368.1 DNA-binding transcriptional regulator, LacI/PurR family [Leifsonia sp. CL154]SFL88595.1 DNA-binding transcriptional regulator, LacI/PurR family [Leifsonia sp. CL147]
MNDNGTSNYSLLAPARRSHVLASLSRDGVVRISQLIDELGVSPVTLRRDLAQLEEEGLLVRIHGGAVPPAVVPDEGNDDAPSSAADPAVSRTIAVLVPSLNYYWPGVTRGMEQEARRRGVRVIVRAASYSLQDERPVLERFVNAEGVDGLIVAPNTETPHRQDVIQWLAECGVPSVLVEREAVVLPGNEPVESVTSDHALGAVLAARHLAGLGHRTVGLVISRDSPTSRKISRGWDEACRELDLTPTEHFESFLPDRTSPDFSAAVDAALDTAVERGTTALLVHPDPEAMAFADLALARGIRVPEDLSIIAYDDEVAAMFSPALTAVRPPREALGAAAVDLLLRRLEDPARPVHRVTVSPALNVRASTAPPPVRGV